MEADIAALSEEEAAAAAVTDTESPLAGSMGIPLDEAMPDPLAGTSLTNNTIVPFGTMKGGMAVVQGKAVKMQYCLYTYTPGPMQEYGFLVYEGSEINSEKLVAKSSKASTGLASITNYTLELETNGLALGDYIVVSFSRYYTAGEWHINSSSVESTSLRIVSRPNYLVGFGIYDDKNIATFYEGDHLYLAAGMHAKLSLDLNPALTTMDRTDFAASTEKTSALAVNTNVGYLNLSTTPEVYGTVKMTVTICEKTEDFIVEICEYPTGHQWDEGVWTKHGTCTGDGEMKRECLNCGLVQTETVKAAGHTWDAGFVTKEPGCATPGEKKFTCTVCNAVTVEKINPLGHVWDKGVIINAPTCLNTGKKYFTCRVCGGTKIDLVDATGHSWARDNKLTNSAYIVDSCKSCGETKKTMTDAAQFVARMYVEALDRQYDEDGLKYWCDGLASKDMDGAWIGYYFLESKEFTAKNVSKNDFIRILYKSFLGRKADDDGYYYWLNLINSGVSREQVVSGFVNSNEFSNICASFGINRGYMYANGMPVNVGVGQFVERLYEASLGRKSDATGVNYWTEKIATKEMTPLEVAKGFYESNEFLRRKLTNSAYVEALYQTFMGRASDDDGKAYWVTALNNGSFSRDQALEGFSNSNEFKKILNSYGLL